MDNTEFVAHFVSNETQRINEQLKQMLNREARPSQAEQDAILADIERTLSRLQSAVLHIGNMAAADIADAEKVKELLTGMDDDE